MIKHMVFFTLKHHKGSPDEALFLERARQLDQIPGVSNFKVYRQVSPKNNYDLGLSMIFRDDEDYEAYNKHPDHRAFVENIWLKEVEDFMEVDCVEIY